MSGQYSGQLAEVAMTEAWKQWEGQTVNGEFQLLEYLGGSEHGAVFETRYNDRDPQAAAIKLVAQNSPNVESQLASWHFASTLSHPNLIRILQTGHGQIGDAKFFFAVMEYADENLSQIVPHRPLTEDEASEMLHPALDALAYLHAKGFVHGHLKPANIMASGDQLKLSTDGLHRAGEPISEPGDYDPPENTSSPAGDVWSFGVMLVEVLTQRLPAWDRNSQGDPETPETLPAPLLDIARHCLRRDARRRWTIADIANRLQPVVVEQPTAQLLDQATSRPVQRSASPARSRYLIPAVILFLALVLVSLKLWNHSPRGNPAHSQTSLKSSGKAPPARRQAKSAAPSESKSAAPSEKQSVGGTSQIPAPAPPAPAPKVPAAGAASTGVIHQVLPDVSQKAMGTIRGTVRVGIQVSVDPSGNVTDATIDSPGPSQYFANLALQAARQWKFAPAGEASSDWTLYFEFSADGTKASAAH